MTRAKANKSVSQRSDETVINDCSVAAITEKIVCEPDNAELYAARAEAFLARGDLVTAVHDYNCALKLSARPLYYSRRADLLFQLGDDRQALADCDSVILAGAPDGTAYLLKAKFCFKNRDFAQALQLCNNDKITSAKDTEISIMRANCLDNMDMSEEAIAELERFSRLYGAQVPVQLKLAELNYHQRRFNEALRYVDQLLIAEGGNLIAQELKAHILFAVQDYGAAAKVIDSILHVSPELAEMYFLRGHCLAQQAKYDDAAYNYSRAIELQPNISSGYFARAELHYSTKNYEAAILDYSKTIALEPENNTAYLMRGRAYLQIDRIKSALKDFSYAQMIDPTSGAACFFKGVAYERIDENEKALLEYQKAKKNQFSDVRVTESIQRLLLQK